MASQDLWSLLIVAVTITVVSGRSPLRAQFPKHDAHALNNGEDAGKPLFLTPYIERGDVKLARNLSMVTGLNTSAQSYSGFLTVNKTYNSNMFFWLCVAEENPDQAPLLLWLQGGPGGSSLFGLFVEHGPFGVDRDLKLFPRGYAWTKKYNVLYIDNPVQTGFSFTENTAGMATTEAEVGENLYRAMVQIYQLFPTLQSVDFYITGESYAGKYIPALGHRIHSDPSSKIPLKGVAIGDGFSDPPVMIHAYADFLYQTGLLDENQASYFKTQTDYIGSLIAQGNYTEAFQDINKCYAYFNDKSGINDMYNYLRTESWDRLLNGDQSPYPSYFANATGGYDYYNFLRSESPKDFEYYNQFLALPAVRRAIHVGNLTYNSGEAVEKYLTPDIMQSVKPWLAELMDNYRVMIYSGQLDIIVALPLTQAMLQTVPWSGLDAYKSAKRGIWKVDPFEKDVAGYVRKVNQFYQVMVRGGGHILPYDQPRRAFNMIEVFISGREFY